MGCELLFLYNTIHQPSGTVTCHHHECYELVYYIAGDGLTSIGDITFTYRSGTYAIIQPGQTHDEQHITKTEVLFAGIKITNDVYHPGFGVYSDNYQHIIYNYLLQIKEEFIARKKSYNEMNCLLVRAMLIGHERLDQHEYQENVNLDYITGFIEENYGRPVNLNELAKLLGYSYHHFRHLFKQKTGYSPNSYIIYKRIEGACRLLLETTLSIGEISFECGFSNASQFSFMFRRATNCTPSEFRKSAHAEKVITSL